MVNFSIIRPIGEWEDTTDKALIKDAEWKEYQELWICNCIIDCVEELGNWFMLARTTQVKREISEILSPLDALQDAKDRLLSVLDESLWDERELEEMSVHEILEIQGVTDRIAAKLNVICELITQYKKQPWAQFVMDFNG